MGGNPKLSVVMPVYNERGTRRFWSESRPSRPIKRSSWWMTAQPTERESSWRLSGGPLLFTTRPLPSFRKPERCRARITSGSFSLTGIEAKERPCAAGFGKQEVRLWSSKMLTWNTTPGSIVSSLTRLNRVLPTSCLDPVSRRVTSCLVFLALRGQQILDHSLQHVHT
jgi:hypothetical protein